MPLLSLWRVRNEQSALVLQVIVNINFVVPNLYLLAVPCSWQSHIIRMLPTISFIRRFPLVLPRQADVVLRLNHAIALHTKERPNDARLLLHVQLGALWCGGPATTASSC